MKIPKEMFAFFEAAFMVMLMLTIIYVAMLFFVERVRIDNQEVFETLAKPLPGFNCKREKEKNESNIMFQKSK